MAIIILSSLPYIHDLITVNGEGLQGWVPDFGLQQLLTGSDGYILGFSSYRVFLYTLCIHVFAHIGWVGWFFEAIHKLYRPFLLVPVSLSLYQIIIIVTNSRTTVFNEPDIKFLLTIGLSVAAAINFYYNNRTIINGHLERNSLRSPENTNLENR